MEEEIKRLRGVGKLECMYYGNPHATLKDVPQEDPENKPFTRAIRNMLVRETPASLRSSVVAVLIR